jgi:hypothetical protein
MILVENDADKAKVLDNLLALYNKCRDFSWKINDLETGMYFWEHLLSMILLRAPSQVRLFLQGRKEVNFVYYPLQSRPNH